MTLFIRRFSKMMGKQKFFKGDKKTSLNQRARGLATIVASMVIILLIVSMSVEKKMMTRRRRRSRKATRNTSNIRRKPMVRHIMARIGTPMMRARTSIVTMWPP
jgi:hypothetical protein